MMHDEDALDGLDMRFPELNQDEQRDLRALRKQLAAPEEAKRARRARRV